MSESNEDLLSKYLPKPKISDLVSEIQREDENLLGRFIDAVDKEGVEGEGAAWLKQHGFEDESEVSDSYLLGDDNNVDLNFELSENFWMKTVTQYPPLGHEVHVTLAKNIEAGVLASEAIRELNKNSVKAKELTKLIEIGKNSQTKFENHNLRLVFQSAKKYSRDIPFEDRFQNGYLGLHRAVQKWDWRQGYQFSTYAVWWIRQSLMRECVDDGYIIRIPVHLFSKIIEYRNHLRDLFKAFEIEKEDLFKFDSRILNQFLDGTKEESFIAAFNALRPKLNFEDAYEECPWLFDEKVYVWEDTVFNEISADLLKIELHNVLDTIASREAGVIAFRYGLLNGNPLTLDDIGQIYGVTRERIRQIESKTMSKLRHPSRSEALKHFLEN